jgi:hypothetical protein
MGGSGCYSRYQYREPTACREENQDSVTKFARSSLSRPRSGDFEPDLEINYEIISNHIACHLGM